jgi:hypothetical protein
LSEDDINDIQDLFLGLKEKHDVIELGSNEDIDNHFRLVNVLGKPGIYYEIDTRKTFLRKTVFVFKITWSRFIEQQYSRRKHGKDIFENDLRDFIKNIKDRYETKSEFNPDFYRTTDATTLYSIRIESKKPLTEGLTKWLIDKQTKDIPSIENIDYCFHDDNIFIDINIKPMIVDLSDYEKIDDKYILKNNIYALPRYNHKSSKGLLQLLELDPSEDLVVGYQVVVTFDKEYHQKDQELTDYISNVRKKLNQIDCDILIYHNEIFGDDGKDFIFTVLTKNKLAYDKKY